MQRLYRKRIVLGVGGGIAAYKSAELVRRLRDHGAEVRVVMTQGGREFITPSPCRRSPAIPSTWTCSTPRRKRPWGTSNWLAGQTSC